MKRKPKFEVYSAADGYRWRLKAVNGRILATGEAHSRRADAERAARTVMTTVMAVRFPMTAMVPNSRKVMA
jgi:uncharacterized protein YegP (UPF0339 family)